MEPPSSPSSKKPKSHKSATFQLQDIHPSLNVNQDDDNDDAAGVSNNDDKVPTEPTMTPPTRFRPGTPAPSSRANSPHVKQKLHQMSMSDIDNDDDNKVFLDKKLVIHPKLTRFDHRINKIARGGDWLKICPRPFFPRRTTKSSHPPSSPSCPPRRKTTTRCRRDGQSGRRIGW